MSNTIIRPRGARVLIREETVDTLMGLHVPQRSIHGKRYVVVLAGPDVKDLSPGDIVFLSGNQGEHWLYLPGHRDLLIATEDAVPVVVGHVEDEVEKKPDGYEECHP